MIAEPVSVYQQLRGSPAELRIVGAGLLGGFRSVPHSLDHSMHLRCILFLAGLGIALSAPAATDPLASVDPVVLTEYAVIFSVAALPLTYLPILLVANDRGYMGAYRNGRLANVLIVVRKVDRTGEGAERTRMDVPGIEAGGP